MDGLSHASCRILALAQPGLETASGAAASRAAPVLRQELWLRAHPPSAQPVEDCLECSREPPCLPRVDLSGERTVSSVGTHVLFGGHLGKPVDARVADDVVRPAGERTIADRWRKRHLPVIVEHPPGFSQWRNDLLTASAAAQMRCDVVGAADVHNSGFQGRRKQVDEPVPDLVSAFHRVSAAIKLSLTEYAKLEMSEAMSA